MSGITDHNGDALAGGKVLTYAAGGLVAKDTYADAARAGTNANPIVLDALRVSVERRNRRLERSGYFQRRDYSPGGFFVEREEIEKRNPIFLTDLFRRALGFRVVPTDGFGNTVVSRRAIITFQSPGNCVPAIYLDGMQVEGILDHIVHPDDVEAIEAYAGISQIPSRWLGFHSACGVVVIWTRRGGGG
jgi:hypothetical protein